jgi:hypothetical protein
LEANFNNRSSRGSCRSNPPREERKNSVCDNVALPSDLGFVPHQVTCNYHAGRSGEHSNEAAASMAHECVTVRRAGFVSSALP